ncbi:hypothetical protein FDP41_007221 [Naegleria fowleri]|uniref:RGS domain-containing protein n=1 Tax=Naegleria fowleri TaxID=5763 RepID=A0A6A5BIE1_NAEFO|nr:uncharacterized protein FDP41_007221 [Naegleria fowleri]KAF0973834.1 hypothetical protein FDP41_007221 [Naegleria fowleri]
MQDPLPSPNDGNNTLTVLTTTTTTTITSFPQQPSQPIDISHVMTPPRDNNDDNDACSDDDSIIVHFKTKRINSIKPLQLSSLQQHEQEMDRRREKSLSLCRSTPPPPPPIAMTMTPIHAEPTLTPTTLTLKHPQATVTVFTKTTSKTSTRSTTHSSTIFRIPTCCGVIELNLIRVLSLLGMMINICCFIAVAVVVGNSFRLEAKREISLLLQRARFIELYDRTSCIVNLAAVTGSLSYVSLYYESQANTSRVLLELSKHLPSDVNQKTKFDPKNPYNVKFDQQVIEAVRQGDLKTANKLLKSITYIVMESYASHFIEFVTNEIKTLSSQKQEYLKYSSTVNMVLVLSGVVISVPIVISIFVMALTSEQTSTRKLLKATSLMILETLRNEKTSQLFKEFCEKENKLDKYTFLENCHTYREMCDKSMELRGTLPLNRIGDESNQEQLRIEKNKYEMAFKIFTEFIDVNGEHPFPTSLQFQENIKKKLDEFSIMENSSMDAHLFDELEKDIADSLMDSFMKFKKELRKQKKKQNKE